MFCDGERIRVEGVPRMNQLVALSGTVLNLRDLPME